MLNKGLWDRVKADQMGSVVTRVIKWADAGLNEAVLGADAGVLLLNLGDCPQFFELRLIPLPVSFDQAVLERIAGKGSYFEFGQLYECVTAEDPETALFRIWDSGKAVVEHDVSELEHDLLSWNVDGSLDYHGEEGYLLWLLTAGFALAKALKKRGVFRRLLGKGRVVYVLVGFESIFTMLCVVDRRGVRF